MKESENNQLRHWHPHSPSHTQLSVTDYFASTITAERWFYGLYGHSVDIKHSVVLYDRRLLLLILGAPSTANIAGRYCW